MKYPSNLTNAQWSKVKPVLLACRTTTRGRPIERSMREVIDAILYVVKTDCQWRQLPDDFGPWMSVYSHFRRMRLNGTWEKIERALQQKIRKGL